MSALQASTLSELISRFGSYDRVTTAAWAEFDAVVKQ